MIRVRFSSGSEYFLKIRFMFSSSSVNVGFSSGSCTFFTVWVRFGSVLGKTRVLGTDSQKFLS